MELDRQLSEPQREKKVKDLQKYGTIVEERSGSQANVAEKERLVYLIFQSSVIRFLHLSFLSYLGNQTLKVRHHQV